MGNPLFSKARYSLQTSHRDQLDKASRRHIRRTKAVRDSLLIVMYKNVDGAFSIARFGNGGWRHAVEATNQQGGTAG